MTWPNQAGKGKTHTSTDRDDLAKKYDGSRLKRDPNHANRVSPDPGKDPVYRKMEMLQKHTISTAWSLASLWTRWLSRISR